MARKDLGRVVGPQGPAGAVPYVKDFAASDWSGEGKLTIPASEHKLALGGGVALVQLYMRSGTGHTQNWSTMETAVTIDADRNVILDSGGTAYAGKAIMTG